MDIRNPQYATADQSAINCEVFAKGEWLPFTARGDDVEAHGREIFALLQAGEAGEIAPYVPPSEREQALRTIVNLETEFRYTHRGHRERDLAVIVGLRALVDKVNALEAEIATLQQRNAELLPPVSTTHLEQVIVQVDAAIRAEREKL